MKVYIKIRHWNFWYGVYGLTVKSHNDEFWMYADVEAKVLLGYFDVSTKICLENTLESNLLNEDEKKTLRDFYNKDDEILFEYIYPYDQSEKGFDLLHAPKNMNMDKPNYINVWFKTVYGWDMDTIRKCAKVLACKFLHKNVEVQILDIPSYEETKINFKKCWEPLL